MDVASEHWQRQRFEWCHVAEEPYQASFVVKVQLDLN